MNEGKLMKWNIEYLKEAQRDLKRLDPYNRKIILKAIEKVSLIVV